MQAREKEAFGGMKFGSAFFGWLTSIGAIVLLAAVVSAIAALIGIDTDVSTQDLRGVGIGVAVALLVILFIAYFTGGYVAGRMARFNGLRQGVAVWLWAVAIALVLTAAGLIVDGQSDITSQVNLPAIPVSSSELTTGGLIGLAIVLITTLIAAIFGGLAGMRFHRRVDKAGFDVSQSEREAEKEEVQRTRATDPAPVSDPYEQPHGPVHSDGSRTEAPRTGTPRTETPGTETPGTETPRTETPGTETPRTETPGTETPRTETPRTETPGTETPRTETPGTERPGTETPGTGRPGTERPGTAAPHTDEPPSRPPS